MCIYGMFKFEANNVFSIVYIIKANHIDLYSCFPGENCDQTVFLIVASINEVGNESCWCYVLQCILLTTQGTIQMWC